MEARCWHVDAFTNRPFSGNPAAVYWLEFEPAFEWMQSMAAEMNLSETAFVWRSTKGLELRWFTPTMEVDLCGHATLATARALWSDQLFDPERPLAFHTRSGLLTCHMRDELIELDFPATPPTEIVASEEMLKSLNLIPKYVGTSRFYQLAILESEDQVRSISPDFDLMKQIPTLGVIVSAPSSNAEFDFVSRFFAPAMGVDEDPVCGSAHCVLAPYWSQRLGKSQFIAYQASNRGGILHLKLAKDRVLLAGHGFIVWRGKCYS